MTNLDTSLTADDLKVLKHLQAIDNLFRKGNLTIHQLFVDNYTLCVTKLYNGKEYEIEYFHNIKADGGDPNRWGDDALHDYDKWFDMITKLEEGGKE